MNDAFYIYIYHLISEMLAFNSLDSQQCKWYIFHLEFLNSNLHKVSNLELVVASIIHIPLDYRYINFPNRKYQTLSWWFLLPRPTDQPTHSNCKRNLQLTNRKKGKKRGRKESENSKRGKRKKVVWAHFERQSQTTGSKKFSHWKLFDNN